MVATLLALMVSGCGEDPILKRAREQAGADAAASSAAPPPPGAPPGSAAATPPAAGAEAPGDPGAQAPGLPGGAGATPPADPSIPPPGGSIGAPGSANPSQAAGKPGVPVEPKPAPEGAPGGGPPGIPGVGAPGGSGAAAPLPPPPSGPTLTVSGVVAYAGWKAGEVRVDGFDGDHSRHGLHPGVVVSTRIDRPGPFTLTVAQGLGKLYIEAAVDEDKDGKPGPLDPMGAADRYPVTVGDKDIVGLTITLVKREPPPGGGKGKDF